MSPACILYPDYSIPCMCSVSRLQYPLHVFCIQATVSPACILYPGYSIPCMCSVSRLCINVLTKAISFLVFSMMMVGSEEEQRRKFGANTIDRLEASILVIETTSGLKINNSSQISLPIFILNMTHIYILYFYQREKH